MLSIGRAIADLRICYTGTAEQRTPFRPGEVVERIDPLADELCCQSPNSPTLLPVAK